jgi:hypothetical protein
LRLKKKAMYKLSTKRMVLAQLSVCLGCCCGKVDRGKPELPLTWLKEQWRQRGLTKHVQLTVSGCLGPCDLSNVATVSTSSGSIWLGNIQNRYHYQALVEWASQIKDTGRLHPVPDELADLCFDPFRSAKDECTATIALHSSKTGFSTAMR